MESLFLEIRGVVIKNTWFLKAAGSPYYNDLVFGNRKKYVL